MKLFITGFTQVFFVAINTFFISKAIYGGSIFTYIQKTLNRYFGKIEYKVTIVSVSGNVEYYYFPTIKEVDDFITKINAERYWDVQKIEKFRIYEFFYKKEIIHSPLHYSLPNVTENEYVFNHDYSFLKRHNSLKNIKRVSTKQPLHEAAS